MNTLHREKLRKNHESKVIIILNSIFETRIREKDGHYHINLTIPKSEYEMIYENSYNPGNAADILTSYLESRGDDGKPTNICIKESKSRHVVEIEADLAYLENEHTTYKKETGHFFEDIMNEKDRDVWTQQKNNR